MSLSLLVISDAQALNDYAYSCDCPPCHQSHDWAVSYPYLGIMGGGVQIKNDLHVKFPDNINDPPVTDNTTFSRVQGIGGVALGYASHWERWYFAAEASTLPFPVTTSKTWTGTSGLQYNSLLSLNNFFNADGLPGYYFTPCFLGYLRGGVAVANLHFEETNFFGDNRNARRIIAGPRFGAGFDIILSKRISVGADYIYTNYGFNTNFRADVPPTSFTVKNYTNQVLLHLHYNFT